MTSLLNEAIATLTYEGQLDAVTRLEKSLAEKSTLTEETKKVFEDLKADLKKEHESSKVPAKKGAKGKGAKNGKGGAGDAPKPKKAPSAYNIFIRDKIAEIKKNNPATNGKDLMKLATVAWKNRST
jgi:hypothetical protein